MHRRLDSWAGLQILPKHILQGQDINTTAFARNPVGSHYYQLEDWRNGERISLVRNPKATQGQAHIDRIVVSRFIPDPASQFLELLADNIDIMILNPIQYARIFPSRPDLTKKIALYRELGNGYTYLGFNLKHKPFDDIRVTAGHQLRHRQAGNDRRRTAGPGRTGRLALQAGYALESIRNCSPTPTTPRKPLTLLKQAGFEDHDGDGILDRDGKPLAFEILTNQNKQREMSAVLIQRRLKEIGIDVQIRVLEWASFLGRFIKTGDFDVVVLGWSLSLDPDQFSIWHSSQPSTRPIQFYRLQQPTGG